MYPFAGKVTGNKKIMTSLRTDRPWEGKEHSNMELSDMYLGEKKNNFGFQQFKFHDDLS